MRIVSCGIRHLLQLVFKGRLRQSAVAVSSVSKDGFHDVFNYLPAGSEVPLRDANRFPFAFQELSLVRE